MCTPNTCLVNEKRKLEKTTTIASPSYPIHFYPLKKYGITKLSSQKEEEAALKRRHAIKAYYWKNTHTCVQLVKRVPFCLVKTVQCVMLWHWSFCRENYFSRNALCSIIIIVVSSTTLSSSSYPSQEYGMTSVKVSI